MGSFDVVMISPSYDRNLDFPQRLEYLTIEQFISHSTVAGPDMWWNATQAEQLRDGGYALNRVKLSFYRDRDAFSAVLVQDVEPCHHL